MPVCTIAGARNHLQANRSLGFCFEILIYAARQELPELALDELRQARAVAGLRHRAQEGLQELGDDLVEHGVLGVAGP